MAEKQVIEMGEFRIQPGQQQSISLPLPSLYSHTPMSLPVHVINGRRRGPVLFVSAAIHGDEINGVEIIRRLLHKKYLTSIRGALIAVPVVNVYGFVNQSRYLPDRRDLNRSFPGSEKGSMAARLADIFMEEVVSQSTHGIDLHTGAIGRDNLPQIRANLHDDPVTHDMACAFGAPVMLNAELRDGSLRETVAGLGIPMLLYEAGEALRFNELSIRAGVRGITSVMRHLGMLPKSRRPSRVQPLLAKSTRWVRASQSGILRCFVALGARVSKNQLIGWIADPFGKKEKAITAPFSGIVIGRTNLPLVHEGEALFHIASFSKPDSAAESVEVFQETYDPMADRAGNQEPPII